MASVEPGSNEAQVASSFPPPPPFYKLYGAQATNGNSATIGPPAPVSEPIQVYDRILDLNEAWVSTHPNAMIRAAADGSIDYRAELQSLVTELLPLYLELVRTLVEAPEQYAGPLSRVSTALAAATHLVNMARPDQARATLEYILQLEVAEKQEALAKLRAQVQALDQQLLDAAQKLVDTCAEP